MADCTPTATGLQIVPAGRPAGTAPDSATGATPFTFGVVAVHSFQGVAWKSAAEPSGTSVKAQGGTLNLTSGFACL